MHCAREGKDCGGIFCNEIGSPHSATIQEGLSREKSSQLSLQIVADHCVLYFYPQHFLFPWTFPGDAWLWVCWDDFSRESPSWFVAEWGLPISSQNMPPQFFPSLAQCIELLDPLMLWDESLMLYLWFTWKWERYISYCGTGKNLIRVTCLKCNYETTRTGWLNELGSWIT